MSDEKTGEYVRLETAEKYLARALAAEDALAAMTEEPDLTHSQRHTIFLSGYGKGQRALAEPLETLADDWAHRGYGMYERCADELRAVIATVLPEEVENDGR